MVNDKDYLPCPESAGGGSDDTFERDFMIPGKRRNDRQGSSAYSLGNRTLSIVLMVLVFALAISNAILLVWFKPTKKPVGGTEADYFLVSSNGQQAHPELVEHIYHDYDDDFLNFNVSIAQEYWRNLFPVGQGLVGLTPDEVKRLGAHHSVRGRSDPTRHVYLVAVFHQLHCLSQARSVIMHLFQDPTYTLREATYHHTMHCVDIVRQALMCASDSSLIWKEEDIKWPGEGGTRVCRNFDALTKWTIEHSYISQLYDPDLLPHGEDRS